MSEILEEFVLAGVVRCCVCDDRVAVEDSQLVCAGQDRYICNECRKKVLKGVDDEQA